MKLSKEGTKFLQEQEDFRSKPYLDGGDVPTVGFGTTRYPSGKKVSLSDPPLSFQQAEAIFRINLVSYEEAVTSAMDINLEQHEFDALVSLCYNIGISAFKKSTLVKIADRKDGMMQEAAQILRWNKDNGVEVRGLVNRRRRERCMFLGLPYDD
jgi:lysozyme